MGIIKPIIVTGLSIFILAFLLPGVQYSGWGSLLAASVVLAFLQKIVRPILSILLLPINLITLGLFSGVINVLILWMALLIVPGFHIERLVLFGVQLGMFFTLVFISFVLSLVQSLIELVF
jgi:putative membrane protein